MYLVLNLGLKSIRAIVFNCNGKIVSNRSLPLSTMLNGVCVEQSGEEWWEKGIAVIKQALENENVRREVRYVTVTASSCCVVPAREDGSPLANVVMVSDKRAGAEALQIESTFAFAQLKKQNAAMAVNSSLMLPKILWFKNNEPEIFDSAKYFFSPNDFLGFRMTGVSSVDTLNAEKCFFHSETGCYPDELLAELGIPLSKLPEVGSVGDVVSQVTREFKELLGIGQEQSLEYVLSTYDAICAFYGSGASKEGDACDVSGTVTSLRTLVKGKTSLDTSNIFTQYQKEFDISIVGGSNNLGGGLIEWAKQAFYSEHDSPYELMESEAKKIENGSDGVIFLPYLMGERAPLWNDDARGVFFGLARNHNRKHMIRSVFESSGFALNNLVDEIETAGHSVGSVRFSGGLSRIHLIAAIKADILGKEIHIVDEFETTALGAFMLMGVSSGLFGGLEDASKIVTIREIIFPKKESHERYQAIYQLYKSVYINLVDCFKTHSSLHRGDIYRASENIENM